MGAVGLTFVIVAAFLGYVVMRGGQLDPVTPTTEAVASGDLAADAALPEGDPLDAGQASDAPAGDAAPPSDAGSEEDELADASADGASPEPVASGGVKKSNPSKAKLKPRWRPKHR